MQLTLNQEEIVSAVETYVRDLLSLNEDRAIDMDFTAGRGANGLSATVDITVQKKAKTAPSKLRTVEPKLVQSAPEESSDDAEEQVADEPQVEEPAAEVEEEVEAQAEPEAKPASRSIFSKAAG